MAPGKILILNGTSSSGKSSLATELQIRLSEPFIHLRLDDFLERLPKRETIRLEHLEAFIRGVHLSVLGFSQAGTNVLFDHVLQLAGSRTDFQQLFMNRSKNIFLVKVACPLDVLEEREKARGDRDIGLARIQFDLVHQGIEYDFVVDTSTLPPNALAEKLLDELKAKSFLTT